MRGRHRQRNLRIIRGGGEDPVTRRYRFEEAHPEVTIVTPARLNDRWRAVVPASLAPMDSAGTLGDWELGGLMDQLDALY